LGERGLFGAEPRGKKCACEANLPRERKPMIPQRCLF
jgi:hypothetical protein